MNKITVTFDKSNSKQKVNDATRSHCAYVIISQSFFPDSVRSYNSIRNHNEHNSKWTFIVATALSVLFDFPIKVVRNCHLCLTSYVIEIHFGRDY